MLNQKIYQLAAKITLLSFSSLLMLSSCRNPDPTNPTLLTTPAYAPKIPDEPVDLNASANSSDAVWANFTRVAGKDAASRLDLAVENHSDAYVQLVGCDGDDAIKEKFAQTLFAPGATSLPLTKGYAAKWAFLDAYGDGIYAPTHIEDSNFQFSRAAANNSKICYFRIDSAVTLKSLFFQTKISLQAIENLDDTQNQQQQEAEAEVKTAKLQITADVFATLPSMAAALGNFYAASVWGKVIPTTTLGVWMDSKFDTLIKRKITEYNNCYFTLKNGTRHGDYQYGQNLACDALLKYHNEAELINEQAFLKHGGSFEIVLEPEYNSAYNIVKKYTVDGSEGKVILGSIERPSNIARIHDISDQSSTAVKNVLDLLSANPENQEGLKVLEISEHALRSEFVAVSRSRSAKVAFSAAGVASALYFISLLIKLSLNIRKLREAKDNLVAVMSNSGVDNAAAAAWNAQHDSAHQISATAALPVAGNNTVSSGIILNYANDINEGDRQAGIFVGTSIISNPNLRLAQDGTDPYLTDVSAGARNENDAIMMLAISNLAKIDGNSDLTHDFVKSNLLAQGLGFLNDEGRLSAPILTLGGVVNPQSNFSLSQLTSTITKQNSHFANNIILNQNQDVILDVTVPSLGSGETAGYGLVANFIEENESAGAVEFMPVSLNERREQLDSESDAPKFLYSAFACDYPEVLDRKCKLRLHIGGYNDGRHHLGKLYVADDNSPAANLAVYINYRLLSEPSSLNSTVGDASPQLIYFKNAANVDYVQLKFGIDSTPGAKIVAHSCENGLKAGNECYLELDLAALAVGNYTLNIAGILADETKPRGEADISNISINISEAW